MFLLYFINRNETVNENESSRDTTRDLIPYGEDETKINDVKLSEVVDVRSEILRWKWRAINSNKSCH